MRRLLPIICLMLSVYCAEGGLFSAAQKAKIDYWIDQASLNNVTNEVDPVFSAVSNLIQQTPRFNVYNDATQPLTNSVDTKINYNTETFDIGDGWDAVQQRYEPPYNGAYFFSAITQVDNIDDGSQVRLFITVDGVNSARTFVYSPSDTADPSAIISLLVELTTNNYVEVYVYQNSAGTNDISAGSTDSFFTGWRIGD